MDNLWLGGIIKPMKSAFSMLAYYFIATVIGTLAAAFIYMVCCDLTLLVAGEGRNFFVLSFFARGLLVSFPAVVSVCLGLIVLYGLRHQENHFVRLVTYILLGALTWLILIPLSFDLEKKYEEKFSKKFEVSFLSPGYFRKDAGGIFYFSKVDEKGFADGVFLDLSGVTGKKGKVVRFKNSVIDEGLSKPFADSLIRDAVKLPFVIVAPLEFYSTMMIKAKAAWNNNFMSWLAFSTFALALLSVIAFQYVSRWRLVNGLLILFSASLILTINYSYYAGFLFFDFFNSWETYISNLALGKSEFLQNLLGYDEPVIVMINILIFALLLVSGTLLYIFNGRKIGGRE